ncbi:hypothetical protein MC885_013665 [Smutsia gigantea]|nr:hypothetical protein MC885_013665 [Smutsia gigantea]
MVKLTAELIEQAAQYTSAMRDRELDLRRHKIPVIENLGATLDQSDSIDFSDNEIRKLDGFPLLRRLKTLLVNNNRICRVGEGLDQALPCLSELILTNNSLVELGDLDPLASLKSLTYLSILRNSVTNKKHYRLYVIYKVPQLRVLDFQKVKLKVSIILLVISHDRFVCSPLYLLSLFCFKFPVARASTQRRCRACPTKCAKGMQSFLMDFPAQANTARTLASTASKGATGGAESSSPSLEGG